MNHQSLNEMFQNDGYVLELYNTISLRNTRQHCMRDLRNLVCLVRSQADQGYSYCPVLNNVLIIEYEMLQSTN